MSNMQATTNGQSRGTPQKGVFKVLMGLVAATIVPIISAPVFVFLFLLVVGTEIMDTLVLGIWSGMCATPIVIFHIIVFGLPAAIIGYQAKMIRWWTCTLIGFLVGYIPTFISIATTNIGNISNLKDFQPPDWLLIPLSLPLALVAPILIGIFMGFFGAVGGFSFWAVWRLLTPQEY